VGRTELPAAVLDSGPVVHLDELGQLDLLEDFSDRIVPEAVLRETERLRPGWLTRVHAACRTMKADTVDIQPLVAAFALHAGEAEAIALARRRRDTCVMLCDDAAARLAAVQIGIRVHGTLGVLLRSLRLGRRSKAEVLTLLSGIPSKTTLFIRPSLLEAIREEVERL
jgi:predicted nucleic acid-binding protein